MKITRFFKRAMNWILTIAFLTSNIALAELDSSAVVKGKVIGFDSNTVRLKVNPSLTIVVPRNTIPNEDQLREGMAVLAKVPWEQIRPDRVPAQSHQ